MREPHDNRGFIWKALEENRLHEALTLVHEVFAEYEAPEYSAEGIEEFMRFIDPEAVANMLAEGKIHIWTCEENDRIVGVLGARADHINLLFVNGAYHRRAIARQLLNLMIEQFRPSAITVNSSPYAVEAYRKLGFVDINTEQTVDGIRFTPMKLTVESV